MNDLSHALIHRFIQRVQQQPFEDYCFALSELLHLLQMPQQARFFADKLDADFGRDGGYDRLQELLSFDLETLFFCPKTQQPPDCLPLAQLSHEAETCTAIQQAYDRSQRFLKGVAAKNAQLCTPGGRKINTPLAFCIE